MPLLSRLFLLVAVELLPVIAIQTYNEIDLRRARQVEVQHHALGLAKLAAAEQQQFIEGIRHVLIALSELPAIRSRDTAACEAYFSTIKERYPEFITFIVVDPEGRAFCHTSGSKGPAATGRRYLANALMTGAFTVGEFAVGRRSGRNVLHFALPFHADNARIGGVIIASLSLDWLAQYLAHKDVPRGDALTIADRDGTVLAR